MTFELRQVTMLRREAVSEWLREVVGPSVREDVREAKMMGNTSVGSVKQVSRRQLACLLVLLRLWLVTGSQHHPSVVKI